VAHIGENINLCTVSVGILERKRQRERHRRRWKDYIKVWFKYKDGVARTRLILLKFGISGANI
jgi:hypothetical protein